MFPQSGLDDSQIDDSDNSYINIVRKFRKKEIIGVFNVHVGSKPENYDVQHGGYGYVLSNEEIEKVIEFFAAMSKTVGNKLFKNGESHLTTNESGPSKPSGQLLFGKEKPIEVFEQ